MILNEDIVTKSGVFVIPKGQLVSEAVITRLRNFARSTGIHEPFSVLVPAATPSEPPRLLNQLRSKHPIVPAGSQS